MVDRNKAGRCLDDLARARDRTRIEFLSKTVIWLPFATAGRARRQRGAPVSSGVAGATRPLAGPVTGAVPGAGRSAGAAVVVRGGPPGAARGSGR